MPVPAAMVDTNAPIQCLAGSRVQCLAGSRVLYLQMLRSSVGQVASSNPSLVVTADLLPHACPWPRPVKRILPILA